MVAAHGWEAMAETVEASLAFLHKIPLTSRKLTDLFNIVLLLTNLFSSNRYTFIQACLVDFDYGLCQRAQSKFQLYNN